MNIVFMGTPDFAVTTLHALVEAGHNVVLAVTQPDRPKGRGGELTPPAVKVAAQELGIMVYQPESVKDPTVISELREINADIFVVAAFGQILPKELLKVPRYGCINVHASLLPKYRGAAPIQWAILNGETKTGVTIMQMAEGLDDGDIIMQEKVEISDEETGGSLFDKLAVVGGNLCCMALTAIEEGVAQRIPQDPAKATKVGMIKKEMGRLDFRRPAEEICRYVRGLNPWPGTFTSFGGRTLKIWKASENPLLAAMVSESSIGGYKPAQCPPGMVVYVDNDHMIVKTEDGYLSLDEVQLEGKKRMEIADFLHGSGIVPGEMLGDE
ncbi:MAG: methionyl-tRNA formyltransferase [Lachnospiraceae bacterium]|nr:methionyl-tRNA formyltransferase [Lachnospiraceae bacterium]